MYKPIAVLALFVCLCNISIALEENTNILTPDAKSFGLPSADRSLCAKACSDTPECEAWVYQGPEVGGPTCFLKNTVSAPQGGWTGFTSGLKGEGISSHGSGIIDLTGTWKCNDGGLYYLRQSGNDIYWYGEISPDNPTWSNVMHGTLSSGVITGNWVDVPKGGALGKGTIVLKVESSNHLTIISQTGSFGGSEWNCIDAIGGGR